MSRQTKHKKYSGDWLQTLVFAAIVTVLSGLLPADVAAQTYVGFRGGYGGGTGRMYPTKEATFIWGMPSAGVSLKYRSKPKYVGAIQLDLQYQQQGYQIAENKFADTSYMRRVNSIFMPFMWQPNVQLFKGRAEIFVNLGVYLCYNINSHYQELSKRDGVLDKGPYNLYNIRDNRLGYGLTGGVGFGVYFGPIEWIIEGRYSFGYSDIMRNSTKYAENPQKSPLDQVNISTGFFIRIFDSNKQATSKRKNNKKNGTTGEYTPAEVRQTDTERP